MKGDLMELEAKNIQICADDHTMSELTLTMAYKGSATLLPAIAAAGVDVNVVDFSGMTLLMYATLYATLCSDKPRRNTVAGIAQLLHHGADPNLADDRGLTAFFLALKLHQRDIAELLFLSGADFRSGIH